MKFFIFWMLEKWSCCYCKSKMTVHLTFSTTIATFLIFQPKKRFWKFLNTFEDIAFLLGQCKGKIEIFTFSGCWKSCAVAIAKPKYLCTWNFQPRIATFLVFQPKKDFENSLNTFEDIAFLLGPCKGKNWNFYIFWMLEKL